MRLYVYRPNLERWKYGRGCAGVVAASDTEARKALTKVVADHCGYPTDPEKHPPFETCLDLIAEIEVSSENAGVLFDTLDTV